MNLLPFTKEPVHIYAAKSLTLDELWEEAETLGVLRVWTGLRGLDGRGGKGEYSVTLIGFRRNTKLEIERRHTSLHCAIADAINEAREMGLGEIS